MRVFVLVGLLVLGPQLVAQESRPVRSGLRELPELEQLVLQAADQLAAAEPAAEPAVRDAWSRDAGLHLLALVADGNTLKVGVHKAPVRTLTKAFQLRQAETGAWASTTEEHAIATLAMVQVYGWSEFPPLRPCCQKAVNHLLNTVTGREAETAPEVAAWTALVVAAAKRFQLLADQELPARWLAARARSTTSRPADALARAAELVCLVTAVSPPSPAARVRQLADELARMGLRDAGPVRADDLRAVMLTGLVLQALRERSELAEPWRVWRDAIDAALRADGPASRPMLDVLDHRGVWSQRIGASGRAAVAGVLVAQLGRQPLALVFPR